MSETLSLTLKIWRQNSAQQPGGFVTYELKGISSALSFLEMLDILNEQLLECGEDPVAFESDCREGICGACGLVINGTAHGPWPGCTTCQLHMRAFRSGETIFVEPFRANGFPVVKDLIVDRSALDRVMQRGGYVSVNTGSAPPANAICVSKQQAEQAFDAAACIGCGACVAACKNASAMLFVGAKVTHLASLPQGDPERKTRVQAILTQADQEGFGACTNTRECQAVCPKRIDVSVIARLNNETLKSIK
ncbi:MAG: succinate dehydrogenase/fumarate reductase iron-sulfur subunit [Myxococcota bacterium]